MASRNKPPSDELLQEAAEWRMGGFKWEIVAERIKRPCSTVRKWPARYPERWEAAIERAERRLTVDSNAESVVVLRNMLRVDDLTMRWRAAKTLVELRIELGKLGLRIVAARAAAVPTIDPATDQEYQFFQMLKRQSDEELDRIAAIVDPSLATAQGRKGLGRDFATGESDSPCAAAPTAQGPQGPQQTPENP